jgi:hypothetical protein
MEEEKMSEDNKKQENRELTQKIEHILTQRGERLTNAAGTFNAEFNKLAIEFDWDTCTKYAVDVPNGQVKAYRTEVAKKSVKGMPLETHRDIVMLSLHTKEDKLTKSTDVLYDPSTDRSDVIGARIKPTPNSDGVIVIGTEAQEMYNALATVICSYHEKKVAKEKAEKEKAEKEAEAKKNGIISDAKNDVLGVLNNASWPELEIKE